MYANLDQGSQTQSDLRAEWDSKKGLEGHIEKNSKKLPSNFQLKTKSSWKNRQIVYIFLKTAEFLDVCGPHWTLLGAALDPLGGRVFETAALDQ